MASAAQITANRSNATHSTGPADTSRTRFNGLAHGLTSKQTVISGESQQEYDSFSAELRKNLSPSSALENVLADRVIAAAWRLQRFTRVESAFLTNRIDAYLEAHPAGNADTAFANMFIDPVETARMRLFLRYQTAVQREYDKAFKEFQAAKAESRKKDRELAAIERLSAMEETSTGESSSDTTKVGLASPSSAEARATSIGFASQPVLSAA